MKKARPKKTVKSVSNIAPRTTSNGQSKITPLGSRILIKPFTKEELMAKNSFGIILPDTDSKEKSEQGLILATGPGEYHDGKLVPVTVKVGQRVVFSKYGYDEVTMNGEELYLIKEENILAVLK